MTIVCRLHILHIFYLMLDLKKDEKKKMIDNVFTACLDACCCFKWCIHGISNISLIFWLNSIWVLAVISVVDSNTSNGLSNIDWDSLYNLFPYSCSICTLIISTLNKRRPFSLLLPLLKKMKNSRECLFGLT